MGEQAKPGPEQPPKGKPDDGAGDDNEGAAAPKFMTEAEFNKAFSAREKRFLGSIEKTLTEKFAALAPKPKDDDDDEPAEQQGTTTQTPAGQTAGGQAAAPSNDKEIRKLQKQLARMNAERDTEKKANEEAAAKNRRDTERSKLGEALASAGIAGAKLKAAIALLHTEEARIRTNDEGKIVFVDGDDETDLAAGIKAWLQTEDGKSFAPPRGAAGAGTKPGKPPAGKQGEDKSSEKVRVGREMLRHALRGTTFE